MLATLPMYDFPEVRAATDQFWSALAKRLGTTIRLTRDDDWTAAWGQPDLLFSQTCGYPFTHDYRDRLKLVATPHYDADGCDGPNYCSILFARKATSLRRFSGQVAAFNNRDSMSGMLALKLVFAPLADEGQFFSRALETGGHFASLTAVQSGDADICAIDCVTVAFARRYRPQALAGLVEVARSPHVLALPYVTVGGDVDVLQDALADVLSDESLAPARTALMLKTCSLFNAEDYDDIIALEVVMELRGGLKLW
jgi:ABC-type phosphate/phosphonate transport system substrate-binding protein